MFDPRCPVRAVLFRIRDLGNEMFLVLSGQVEVTLPTASVVSDDPFHPRVVDADLRRLGPGEWFGEVACLEEGSRRTATCVTRRPCDLLVVPGKEVLAVLRASPDAALAIARQLAKRLRAHTERMNRGSRPEPRAEPRGSGWDVFSSWWVDFFAGPTCFVLHAIGWILWFALLDRPLGFFTPTVGLLTNIVSLEAIALCIFILVGQRMQDRREEFRASSLYHWADRADEKSGEILRRLTVLEARLGFSDRNRAPDSSSTESATL